MLKSLSLLSAQRFPISSEGSRDVVFTSRWLRKGKREGSTEEGSGAVLFLVQGGKERRGGIVCALRRALSFLHHPHFPHQLHLMPQLTPANTKSSTVGCACV